MGMEVVTEKGLLGQFASNAGYGDLIHAAKDKSLKDFFKTGKTQDVKTIVAALKSLDTDDDNISSTAKGLADMIDGSDFAIIHDGTGEDNDKVQKQPDISDVHVNVPVDIFGRKKKKRKKKFHPPVEVIKAAEEALFEGFKIGTMTQALADGDEFAVDAIQKIADYFKTPESHTDEKGIRKAWGGKHAPKWAERVFRKIERDGEEEDVEKQGNGLMIAFWPSSEVQQQYALQDGEPADQIHLTLAYYGHEGEDYDPDKLPILDQVMQTFARTHGPIEVTLGGIGRFPASPSSDGKDVIYLGVHSPDILAFRLDLVDETESAGFEPKKNFSYTPHITLKYVAPHAPSLAPTPDPTPVIFDTITVSDGAARRDYKLTGDEFIFKSVGGKVIEVLDYAKRQKKPRCPHCGSSKYTLMPTDFETAKCKDCGKNWDHGIVPGINDPYGKMEKILWVNTEEPCSGTECAVLCNPGTEQIEPGDSLWWQSGKCYWTPKDHSRQDVPLLKVGYSGIPRPVQKDEEKTDEEFTFQGQITKLSTDKQIAFGWFSVVEVEGRPVVDVQDDFISEEDIEKAAYEYTLESREAGDLHEVFSGIGKLIESCVFTKEKQQAMVQSLQEQGIPAKIDLGCVAWWGGFRVDDSAVWKRIKSGDLRAFSIGGKGRRQKIE